jgi:hypothetical protein
MASARATARPTTPAPITMQSCCSMGPILARSTLSGGAMVRGGHDAGLRHPV